MSEPRQSDEKVLLFCLSWFFYNFSYWAVMSYLPIHLKEIGYTRPDVGYCMAIPQFIALCAVVPFGYFSDRFAARRLSQVGIGLMALWTVALALLPKGPALTASFAFAGAGSTLHLVAFNALFLKHLTPETKGRKVGAFVFAEFFGYSLGPMAGPAALKALGLADTLSSVYFYGAAAGFAAALIVTLFLRDAERLPFHLSEYVDDLRSGSGRLIVGILLMYAFHFGAEQAFYPALMREQCGLDQLGVGEVFAYSGVLIAATAFWSGGLFDRRKKFFTTMAIAMIFSGAFQAFTGAGHSFWQMIGIRTPHVIADGVLNCYVTLFVATAFPQHRLGGNYGFVNAVRTISIFLGAVASGHLVQGGGLPMPFYVTGLVCAGAGAILLFFRPQLKRVMAET
ncbi:MAG: MFS transporter [Candidatus Hydrogenedentes bacterium]|nr:MFS transporter [Candidatus Hydrogenedentota bacterium]